MQLINMTSPHQVGQQRTQHMMLQVIAATLPGLLTLTLFFGWGTVINVILCSVFALISEALVLKLRQKSIDFYLRDGSALVTAVLFALAVPSTLPWWASLIGMLFAIIIVKHLFGGLGNNPFNPAMAAYALLLVSLPVPMTQWLPGAKFVDTSLVDAITAIFNSTINGKEIDTYAMATPLDAFKQFHGNHDKLAKMLTLGGSFAGYGWDWVNAAFLLGGVYLLWRKVISWHIPFSFLITLFVLALIFWSYDQDNFASPVFYLFSGATMLGAFFIATDPVTAATSNQGRLIYGALLGLLVFIIRTWGGYPEGIAFAVLILNVIVPTLDYYTPPRTFGH
ncbi:MAG TPA: electron transport complex subunit RsxD, partial [Pseudomonadales bacterium]|nr:electron transport complex subunit RsxD [Pseudomonadales bacterium]